MFNFASCSFCSTSLLTDLIKYCPKIIDAKNPTPLRTKLVVSFMKKNPILLIVFMGGWTKYSLLNSYSKDAVNCNVAGIKSAIAYYNTTLSNGLKKDKELEKLSELESNGTLANWVSDRLKKK